MESLFNIQAEISKVSTMAHGAVRIVADSQENLSDDVKARVMSWHEKTGHLAFLIEKPVEAEDVISLPPLTKQEGKYSKAQLLRFAIRRLGMKMKVADQDAYYDRQMDAITAQVDEKAM